MECICILNFLGLNYFFCTLFSQHSTHVLENILNLRVNISSVQDSKHQKGKDNIMFLLEVPALWIVLPVKS